MLKFICCCYLGRKTTAEEKGLKRATFEIILVLPQSHCCPNMPVERRGVRALQVKKMSSLFNLNLSHTVPLTDVPCTGSVSAYLCMQRL